MRMHGLWVGFHGAVEKLITKVTLTMRIRAFARGALGRLYVCSVILDPHCKPFIACSWTRAITVGCWCQLEKERAAGEEARQQLAEKDALIRELSKDTVQVDKERCVGKNQAKQEHLQPLFEGSITLYCRTADGFRKLAQVSLWPSQPKIY